MRIRLYGAALAAGLVVSVLSASAGRADIVRLRDGKCLPKDVVLEPGAAPSDEQMDKHKDKRVEPLAYDAVKVGGIEVSAGMVDAVWTYDAWVNADFGEGDRSYEGAVYDVAADSFQRAAAALKGSSKQLALWKRALSLAANDDAEGMVAAIDDLLSEFPKSFFLCDVQKRRAIVLTSKNDKAGAAAALDRVTSAPGINKHDLHDAELQKIYLGQWLHAGKNTALWAAAETAYRDRLRAIEGDAIARQELEDLRLRALVGIGRCLVFQNKPAEARAPLEQVVASPVAVADGAMLASAYNGLGDVLFAVARATQADAAGNEALKKKAAEQLDGALLHYLRVTEFYWDHADRSDLLDARLNAARVFAAQFGLSNDKDCEAALKAMNYYQGASKLIVDAGLARTALIKEAIAFKARMDKVPCK